MEYFDLKNKTALITGASSGLGEQFARVLVMAGARVILAARRLDKLKALSEEIGNAKAVELDVSDKSSVMNCFDMLDTSGERIDILVNNAGIAALTPIFDQEENSNFENVIQTNLLGVWYATKQAVSHMIQHGIKGAIINIASINGDLVPCKEGTAYGAAKSSVIHMTKNLAVELAEHNIRINCISPGLFHTPMTSARVTEEKKREQYEQKIPLGFVAKPSDLDGSLLLLASNKCSAYMTGACITVDGGLSHAFSWGCKEE